MQAWRLIRSPAGSSAWRTNRVSISDYRAGQLLSSSVVGGCLWVSAAGHSESGHAESGSESGLLHAQSALSEETPHADRVTPPPSEAELYQCIRSCFPRPPLRPPRPLHPLHPLHPSPPPPPLRHGML